MFQIPFSTTIYESEEVQGLKFPILAKPREGLDHQHLFIAKKEQFDDRLAKGKCPEFLQEFVRHDGIVHKVYVVRDLIAIVQRHSIRLEKFSKDEKPKKFLTANISGYKKRLKIRSKHGLDLKIMYEMVTRIRDSTDLQLFTIDIIIERETNKHFLLDINSLLRIREHESATLYNLLSRLKSRLLANKKM